MAPEEGVEALGGHPPRDPLLELREAHGAAVLDPLLPLRHDLAAEVTGGEDHVDVEPLELGQRRGGLLLGGRREQLVAQDAGARELPGLPAQPGPRAREGLALEAPGLVGPAHVDRGVEHVPGGRARAQEAALAQRGVVAPQGPLEERGPTLGGADVQHHAVGDGRDGHRHLQWLRHAAGTGLGCAGGGRARDSCWARPYVRRSERALSRSAARSGVASNCCTRPDRTVTRRESFFTRAERARPRVLRPGEPSLQPLHLLLELGLPLPRQLPLLPEPDQPGERGREQVGVGDGRRLAGPGGGGRGLELGEVTHDVHAGGAQGVDLSLRGPLRPGVVARRQRERGLRAPARRQDLLRQPVLVDLVVRRPAHPGGPRHRVQPAHQLRRLEAEGRVAAEALGDVPVGGDAEDLAQPPPQHVVRGARAAGPSRRGSARRGPARSTARREPPGPAGSRTCRRRSRRAGPRRRRPRRTPPTSTRAGSG